MKMNLRMSAIEASTVECATLLHLDCRIKATYRFGHQGEDSGRGSISDLVMPRMLSMPKTLPGTPECLLLWRSLEWREVQLNRTG